MNLAINPVLAYVGSAVLFLMWFAAASLILTRKYSIPKTVLIVLLSLGIYFLLPLLPLFSWIRSIVGFLMVIVPIQLLYSEKWYRKLLAAVSILCCMLLAEYLLLIVIPVKSALESGDAGMITLGYMIYLFTNALLLTVLVIVCRNIHRSYSAELDSRIYLLFLLFPISQYFSISGWFAPAVGDDLLISRPIMLLVTLFVFLLADILLAAAFRRSTQSVALQMRNSFLEQQVVAEREHYAALAANYEDIRRMRHDIDNHLYTIKSLLSDGKNEDAAQYAEQLYSADLFAPRTLAGCENTVLASFLLHKKEEIEKIGIALLQEISVPKRIGIEDQDLICAFGNLLDNAAEACVSIPEAKIQLLAKFKQPYLKIHIDNPYNDQATKKKPRIPELSRGLGQEILQHLAERYDGHYEHETKDGCYRSTLFLKSISDEER